MIRFLLRVTVAAIVLGWLLRRVDPSAVGAALATASPLAVVLATLASLVGNVVTAIRLRVLLATQGVQARATQTLAINLAAFFYNLFLPVGGVGVAAIRLQRLSKDARGRFTAALTAMVCDRLVAFSSLGLVGILFWLIDPHPKPTGGLVVLLIGVGTLAPIVAPRAVPQEVRHFVRELTASASGTWWSAVLHRISHAIGSVVRIPVAGLARILGISMLAQLPGALVFVVLGAGLGLPVPALSMGWIRGLVVLIAALPVSIGGFGVREGALVLIMRVFGVPAHDAIAFSLLVFATTVVAPGLLGGVLEGIVWLRAPSRTRHDAVKRP